MVPGSLGDCSKEMPKVSVISLPSTNKYVNDYVPIVTLHKYINII